MDPGATTWDLLERWRAGDRDALDGLLQRDMSWIRRRVHLQIGPQLRRAGDTDDFVQDLAVSLLEDGPRFVLSSRGKFRALLAKMISNQLRGKHRRLSTLKRDLGREKSLAAETTLNLDLPHHGVEQPLEAAALAEQKEWLRLGLLLLEPEDQEVIDLHWQGQSDAEIGARCKCSANTARMRRSRAIGRLSKVVYKLKNGALDDIVESPAGDADS